MRQACPRPSLDVTGGVVLWERKGRLQADRGCRRHAGVATRDAAPEDSGEPARKLSAEAPGKGRFPRERTWAGRCGGGGRPELGKDSD